MSLPGTFALESPGDGKRKSSSSDDRAPPTRTAIKVKEPQPQEGPMTQPLPVSRPGRSSEPRPVPGRMCLAHCGHDTYGVKVRVWRSQQRLECANLLALLLAVRANPQRAGLRSRKKATTSRRTPNAGATAKQRVCAHARSVRRAKQVPAVRI